MTYWFLLYWYIYTWDIRDSDECECLQKNTNMVCLSACLPGTYGKGCTERCKCPRGSSCHHVSGECGCPPGFMGNGCEQSEYDASHLLILLEGLVGFRKLNLALIKQFFDESVWKNISNSTTSCELFLLLHPSACLPGTFGHNCNQVCQCSETNQLCHPVSGSCYCAPGFQGPRCDQGTRERFAPLGPNP